MEKYFQFFSYHVSNDKITALTFCDISGEDKNVIYSSLNNLQGKCSIICFSSCINKVLDIVNNLCDKIQVNQIFNCYSNNLFSQILITSKSMLREPELFSFVIQGLRKHEIDKAKFYYFQFGTPIEGIWDTDELPIIEKEIKENNYFNGQNLYLQLTSTLKGLHKSKTRFTIKCRSDEYYSDFNIFCKTLEENPKKVITGDLFVRKSSFALYHLSDHVIGCETNKFIDAFEYAQKLCRENNNVKNHFAEKIITKSFISVLENIPFISLSDSISDYESYIRKNALIVPLKNMGSDIRCYANCFKRVYNSINDINPTDLISSIDQIFI